ncbi:MAG TPA: 4a-hydroxytetrahydrobiopterin dehydratase [Burkholderiaceae bacterium]|nr:4a-hydroxytetrahydrobiopterin dehydratase [Burkholderiaceae bacterium]
MLTLNELRHAQCQRQTGAAMQQEQIQQQLSAVPTWGLNHEAIERSFKFTDFFETILFINALASIANRQDHHPELSASYNACTVRFATHSVSGISINDFICAAQLDAIYGSLFSSRKP